MKSSLCTGLQAVIYCWSSIIILRWLNTKLKLFNEAEKQYVYTDLIQRNVIQNCYVIFINVEIYDKIIG